MENANNRDIEGLAKDPLAFAIMMDDHQLEHVIVAFVSVLLERKTHRGGENQEKNTEPYSH
jgi:hypothetical protein